MSRREFLYAVGVPYIHGTGGFTTTRPHRIELRTLGRIGLRLVEGSDVEDIVHQPKRLALLVYLAVADPHDYHRRDSLLALFWPELGEKRARNALNKTLHFLRSHLGDDIVVSRGSAEVGLQPDAVWTDAVAFDAALKEGRQRDAIDLYQGTFLDGVHVSDAPEFEHWIDRQRERLESRYSAALEELAGRASKRGDADDSVELWRKFFEHDPSNSRAVIGLMEALESIGDRGAALQHAEEHATLLRDEFDAEPDVEVEAFANRLRHAPRASKPRREQASDNLPWQPTSLVGRDREVAALRRMIEDPSIRLITLTGPGGAGKTRLAVHGASAVRFPDGVFFVNLGTIQDSALVGVTIARASGIAIEANADVREALRAGLDHRRCLLVLDGFETVLPAADLISDLLDETHSLKVIVTSRAVLHLRGERVFPVPPLSVPDAAMVPAIEELLEFGAVSLFVQLAQAADPGFELTEENCRAVAGICAGLDGLPLAIELAAARVRLLEPSMILSRLGQRFDLLRGGPRDLPERQQTLRRTFDWSYDLLSKPQQELFRHLCVFVGGCSLGAVREVCYGQEAEETAVLEELSTLVDNSLLRRVPSIEDEPRFEMLDTIREYGRRLLIDGGELVDLQRAHALCFLRLAERAEPGLAGNQQAVWLDRLEPDYPNVQAVLDWALEWGEIELAVKLGSALWWFLWLRGHFSEMRWRLDQALARRTLLPPALLANLLIARGAIASVDGEHERAMEHYQEALGVDREGLDMHQVNQVLRSMAFALSRRGEYDRATELLNESLAVSREMESPAEITSALRGLAKMNLHVRDYEQAEKLYEEALQLGRDHGDNNGVVWALHGLSEVARHQEKFDRAAALLEEGLRICRELDSKPGIAYLGLASAHVARYQGNLGEARRRYEDALTLLHELGNQRRVGLCLLGLAALDVREHAFDRALILMGAVDPISESGSIQLAPVDQSEYERAVIEIRARLDDSEIERLRRIGREMSPARVLELALSARRELRLDVSAP